MLEEEESSVARKREVGRGARKLFPHHQQKRSQAHSVLDTVAGVIGEPTRYRAVMLDGMIWVVVRKRICRSGSRYTLHIYESSTTTPSLGGTPMGLAGENATPPEAGPLLARAVMQVCRRYADDAGSQNTAHAHAQVSCSTNKCLDVVFGRGVQSSGMRQYIPSVQLGLSASDADASWRRAALFSVVSKLPWEISHYSYKTSFPSAH